MLQVVRLGLVGSLVLGCGPSPQPDAPSAVTVPRVSAEPPRSSAEAGDGEPKTTSSAFEFKFPMEEFLREVDAGEESWSELTLYVRAVRSTERTRDRIELEVRGRRARVMSRSTGENASSARLKIGSADPFRALLRACAENRTDLCRVANLAELRESWDEFDIQVGLSHPELGEFIESPTLGLMLAPLIEDVFAPRAAAP